MGTYTKNLKLETPTYTDNADIPTLVKKNNEILDNEMIKRANGLDYTEQTGVLQLTGNGSKLGSPIQIKNNLPVTSMASGTKLKLNNNKEVIKLSVDGKTEQKSYEGKSLIDYNNSTLGMSTNPLNGISVSIDDGIITLNGTATEPVSFRISKTMENILKSNNNYSFYVENLSGSQSNQFSLILYGNDGSKGFALSNIISTTSGKDVKNITSSKDYNTAYFWFYCDKGTTFNNLKIRLMLVEGDYTIDTIGEFEPYVGQSSPNPDYPQEIKNVRGVENLLNYTDNLQNINGLTSTINSDGSNYLQLKNISKNLFNYTPVLITQVKSNLRTNNIYPNSNILLKKGTYILSFSDMVMKNNIKEFGVQLFDNNTQLATLTLSNNKKSAIFTINNDANISRLYTYLDNSDNNDATITYKNIQLEKGTVATEYEPYKSQTINIDLKGNKLCSDKEQTLKDELIIENGRAKIIKKYDEVILDSNETIVPDSKTTNYYRYKVKVGLSSFLNYPNTLCTHFIYNRSYNVDAIHFYILKSGELLFFSNKTTLNEFKTWLKSQYDSGTPVKVQYELAEPKVIDLGEVNLELLENSTLTCDEEPNMQIDYLTIDSNIFVQDSLDGNSSQKAPSIHAIKEYFNKKVYDKDINGWIKIDFFDHTEYVAEGQILQIDFATGCGSAKLLSLPVGMSSIGERILTGNVRAHDAAITINISGILTETQVTYNWKNSNSTNINTGLNYSLRILEYV